MRSITQGLSAWTTRDDVAVTFLPRRGDPQDLTGRVLLRRASAVARRLEAGRPVLIACPPGIEFVVGLVGTMLAGAIAVPVYPPRSGNRDRAIERLRGILQDIQPTTLLRTRAQRAQFADIDGLPEALEIDALEEEALFDGPPLAADAVRLLQYTSGSTGSPRGVRLTERNLAHNIQHLVDLVDHAGGPSVTCSWVPPYHDMGLIGGILYPLVTGGRTVLMPPESVLVQPRRWFEAIARYRVTVTAVAPFALDRCIARVPADPELDLSSLGTLMVSTEPIPTSTLEAFARTFAPCGLDPTAVRPAYGLAESTLIVSAAPVGHLPKVVQGVVSCGQPVDELIIVDEHGTPVADGQHGEIWVRGPCVGDGYENHSEGPFGHEARGQGDGWLRTGDIGSLVDGELFIHGRQKDVVTQRGRQHHAHDLEATIAMTVAEVSERQVVAFAELVPGEAERLVVLVEQAEPTSLHAVAIRRALNEQHGLGDCALCFMAPGSIRWTTSGKKARRVTRDAWLRGQLTIHPVAEPASPDLVGNPLYPRLASHADKLDARDLAYRYDLERDLPWNQADAPGVHMTDELVAFAYSEFRPLLDDLERRDFVQWALGLATCEVVVWLESSVVQFVQRQHEAIEADRPSLVALVDEEHKHMAMFQRYADHLRQRHPEWIPDYEAALAQAIARVPAPSLRGKQPAVWHFAAWVRLLIFEEWSVWIHARLKGQDGVQPLWSALHRVHAREEIQHVRTDAAWLDSLELDAATRNHFVRGLPLDVMRRLQVVNHTVRAVCEKRWPELRLPQPDAARPLVALLRDPAFRYTRAIAPELVALVERGLPQEGASSTVAYVPHADEALDWLARFVEKRGRRVAFDPDASFAELGMDSVDRLELAGALDDWLGGELPSTLTYELPTPHLLAQHLAALVTADYPDQPNAEALERAPATVRQSRWLDVVPGAGRSHNVVGAWIAPAGTTPEQLVAALEAVAAAHPVLRRRFERGPSGWWQIQTEASCELEQMDGSRDLIADLHRHANALLDLPWNPAHDPSLRARILSDGARCALVWSAPHAIADAGARLVFIRSVDDALQHRLLPTPDPAVLAVRERVRAGSHVFEARLGWWRKTLADLPPTPSRAAAFSGRVLRREISALRASQWMRGDPTAAFTQLLTAYAWAWQTTRGQEAVIGTQFGERATAERRQMFGYLNDVVLIRPRISSDLDWTAATSRVERAWRKGVQRRVPVDAIVRDMFPDRWAQRWLPAPVSFNYLPPVEPSLIPRGWDRVPIPTQRRSFLFYQEMLLVSRRPDGGIDLTCWYDSEAVGRAAATTTLDAFEAVLDDRGLLPRTMPPVPRQSP